MKPHVQFIPFTLLLLYTIAVPLFFIEQTTFADDFIVTLEDDSGPGTLRQAILDLNSTGSGSELNTITFALNVNTINLLTPLPPIENSVSIDGFATSMVNCSTLSPVDDPQQFSEAISVAIDGSNIPSTGSTRLVGITICADDVTIRGLRIENFTNIENAQIVGIESTHSNTLIECCEVTQIQGNNSSDTFTIIGINSLFAGSLVSKCFVHNVHTIDKQAASTNINTGNIAGINFLGKTCHCRVEHIQSGSIYTTPGSNTTPSLISGSIIGIANDITAFVACSALTRQCECPTECQELNCIQAENCIITCCNSGSIFATETSDVVIGSIQGIKLQGNIDTTEAIIDGCTVSFIHTGSANLSDGTFNLQSSFAIGINTLFLSLACIRNNTIANIQRGAVELDGINSNATLENVLGIFASVSTILIENNSISNITCKKVTNSGVCTTITETSTEEAECIGNLASPVQINNPICSGMMLSADIEMTLCNNSVSFIDAGKRVVSGEQSLIISKHTTGINASAGGTIIAEDNIIRDVSGPQLTAHAGAQGIFGGIGSKGISLITQAENDNPLVKVERNTVERISEQYLRTDGNTPGGYLLDLFIPLNTTTLLHPTVQTSGIFILSSPRDFNSLTIQANDNIVNTITGSSVTGKNSGPGSMAVGINIQPSAIIDGSADCSYQGTIDVHSTVQSNTINTITSGTSNNAYGIFIDNTLATLKKIGNVSISASPAFFGIENNTIKNINGHGTPQPFEAPELSLNDCGTIEHKIITYVPFPYQPTSGIYTLFANCTVLSGNTIANISKPDNNARGITTHASSDMDINYNSISGVKGYGVFVGGAIASIDFVNNTTGLFTEAQFENIFASTRNKIDGNSTFNNTKQGIELGLIDWDSYFQISESQCKKRSLSLRAHQEIPEDSVTIFGNHGQIAPCIENVSINQDTVTIDITFKDTSHIFTNFIIQFFANNSNSVPHGEHPISNFNDPQFVITTDINGNVVQRFTFIPTHSVNKTDIISAHVTVAEQQPSFVNNQEKGDTSEFTQQQKKITPYPIACHTQQKPYSFMGQLCH